MSRVAVLGAGTMGSGIARNMARVGHEVVVYNRDPKKARKLERDDIKTAGTAREAAESADIVMSSVTDDEASHAVWYGDSDQGAVHGLRENTIAIESSTLTPAWIRELGADVAACGGAFLDAPVVGTKQHVESGKLIYLVGGEKEVLDRSHSVLAASAAKIQHVGAIGMGMTMKLAINAMLGVQAAALSELVNFLDRAGIEPKAAIELLNSMPTASPAAQRVASLISSRSFAPNFPIRLVEKDLRYLLAAVEEANAQTPLASTTYDIFAQAEQEDFGEHDISGVYQLYE